MRHSKGEIIRLLIVRTFGNFFILFTIFGFGMTFGPALYFEALYRVSSAKGIQFAVANTTQAQTQSAQNGTTLLDAVLSGRREQILIPKSTEFSIVIPKIGASAQVSPNVDPSNEKEYLPVLQKSVAHAKGTAFPGMNGNTYLFAHSADNFWNVGRYNAVFYLLYNLEKGDEVTVFFQNVRYNYVVYDKKITSPTDVSYLSANIGKGEMLTLQTCWPPGTTWKRLLVFARPKGK